MKLSLLIVPFFGAGYASAHGFLSTISISSKAYTGNNPFGDNGASVIRKISSPDPNYGASNAALTCGPNALAASQVADANPGDTITFDWRGADLSHVCNFFVFGHRSLIPSQWPHNTGPMLTYMASCGSTSCDQFDATQAKWFKIHQVGRKDGNAQWVQQDLCERLSPFAFLSSTSCFTRRRRCRYGNHSQQSCSRELPDTP